jgi:hypothetical protein
VDISGTLVRYGGITKQGTGIVGGLIRSKDGGALKERYEYMAEVEGTGKKKTIVAAARRLGELL